MYSSRNLRVIFVLQSGVFPVFSAIHLKDKGLSTNSGNKKIFLLVYFVKTLCRREGEASYLLSTFSFLF